MFWFHSFQLFLVATAVREANSKVGYFWHVTDLHYDGQMNFHNDARKVCWRPDYEGGRGKSSRKPMGRYGDYSCDSTWELIDSAARTMMSRQNDNVEFVLWTGDGLSHAIRHLKEDRQLDLIQNITDLFSRAFKSQFVFPALGHDDPTEHMKLYTMWSRWLPLETMESFKTGGYYIIELKKLTPQIVVLNTNLMRKKENDAEAVKQWIWLQSVFKKLKDEKKTVYIVGHVPPGSNERQRHHHNSSHMSFTDYHNRKYLAFVRQYAHLIVGQFFGHLHSDTFRVIYEENGDRPISWAMIAPSLTPKRNSDGPNNPGLRLYKFDPDTGQVFDYTQYYLDLSRVDSKHNAEWVVEYNFSTYYSFSEINANNLNILAGRLYRNYQQENSGFDRYYKANSVRINNSSKDCDDNCAHTHFCAITRIDYTGFHHCLQSSPSALSTSRSSLKLPVSQIALLMNMAVDLIVLVKWLTF